MDTSQLIILLWLLIGIIGIYFAISPLYYKTEPLLVQQYYVGWLTVLFGEYCIVFGNQLAAGSVMILIGGIAITNSYPDY